MTDIANSLQVQIGPDPDKEDPTTGRKLVWRKFKDGEQPNQIIVDLFPRTSGVSATATKGTLNFGSLLTEKVEEFLNFNNTTRVALKFPEPSFLTLTKIGNLIDEKGNTIVSSITFDSDTSEVVINKPAFGLVKAEYTAPFKRYTYEFSGSCPPDPPDINEATGEQEEIFDRATLLGTWITTGLPTVGSTLSVINFNSRCPFPQIKGEPNKFIIEIAKQDWTSFGVSGISFKTRIHIFPSLPSVEVNIARQGEQGEAGSVGGIKKCSTESINIKNEFLSFNNSAVQSIRYPLDKSDFGLSNIVPDSNALVDQFGKEISPTFKFEGSEINIVNWTSTASFETTGQSVIVKKGQVYITDPSGNARPVFGVIRASYTVTFDRYLYTHVIDKEGSGENTEATALGDILTAKKGDLTGIAVIPPAFRGINNVSNSNDICSF